MSVSHDLDPSHPVLHTDILSGFHILEADAGTGKTWTIARLVLRALIERQIPIDHIPVLTFTKAAAAELADRIGQLLDQCLNDRNALAGDPFFEQVGDALLGPADSPDPQVRRLLTQARLQLDDALITTIHGFCQRLIQDNALSVGRWEAPAIVADDPESVREAVAQWWRSNVVNGPDSLQLLLGASGLSFDRIHRILARAISRPDTALPVIDSMDYASLPDRLLSCVESLRATWRKERSTLLDWINNSGDVNRQTYNPRTFPGHIEAFEQWLADFPGSVGQPVAALALLDYRHVSRHLNKKANASKPGRFDCFRQVELLNELLIERAQCSEYVASQIRGSVHEQIRQARRQNRVITYDDLLDQTASALRDPDGGIALAQSLRVRYPLAFFDEFQDTDPTQWEIFQRIYLPEETAGLPVETEALSSGLVLVGDPKQAIYSFRNADVQTYLSAREQGATVHRLDQNQRACGALIDAVNRLHQRQDAMVSSRIEPPAAKHGRMANEPSAQPPADGLGALTFVMLGDQTDPDVKLSAYDANGQAVEATVAEIARLLNESAAQPADIAILVRTAFQGAMMKRGLAQRGIGAVEASRDSIYTHGDARELQRLIGAVAEPSDGPLLRGALTSALVGMTLDAVNALADQPAQWRSILAAFSQARDDWRDYGPQMALRTLLFERLEVTERLARTLNGERRLTNLLHLLALLAEDPVANQAAAPAGIWLGRQIESAREMPRGDEATMLRLESDERLVRILTIHISKGLEFPIVFMPFAWSRRRATSADLEAVHQGAERVLITELSARFPKAYQKVILPQDGLKPLLIWEQFSESMRLNYVAMTRAVRRCYYFWTDQGETTAPLAEPRALSYLLDEQATGPRPGDVSSLVATDNQRVHERIAELAADHSTITCRHWQAMIDSATTGESRRESQLDSTNEPLVLAGPARPLLSRWINRSFTSLSGQLTGAFSAPDLHEPRPDHDQQTSDRLVSSLDPQIKEAAPAFAQQFVRGANAGSCLHSILEQTDFSVGVDPDFAARQLRRFSLASDDAPAVSDWLNRVLATPLPDQQGQSFRLSDVTQADTLRELPYSLAVGQMEMAQAIDCVSREFKLSPVTWPDNLPTSWDGFLNGFIDLVVRVNGRYYLIDWKSNWLDQYQAEQMREAMLSHAYHWQLVLYQLALHRMLKTRLTDYAYERDLGACHYLFLRGMTGEPGSPGIYSFRPAREMIESLDAIVGANGDGQ